MQQELKKKVLKKLVSSFSSSHCCDYNFTKGDDSYAHKYHNLEERSRLLSVFEALQLMINFSGLIVAVLALVVSIIVLKDKK